MTLGFATCVGPSGLYERHCLPSISRFADQDALVLAATGARSMFEAYNDMLDRAAADPSCSALLLLHDDVELTTDPTPLLEELLAPSSVGMVGTIGGSGSPSLAWWWNKSMRRGRIRDYRSNHDHGAGPFQVDAADDVILCASRWLIDNVRFPTGRYTGFEGLGVILSSMVRAQGKDVIVADLGDVMHHNDCMGFNGVVDWRRNELRWQRAFFRLDFRGLVGNRVEDALLATLRLRMRARTGLARAGIPVTSATTTSESGDPVVDGYVDRWQRRCHRVHAM